MRLWPSRAQLVVDRGGVNSGEVIRQPRGGDHHLRQHSVCIILADFYLVIYFYGLLFRWPSGKVYWTRCVKMMSLVDQVCGELVGSGSGLMCLYDMG